MCVPGSFSGTPGDDTFAGSSGDDTIAGMDGNDTLRGKGGNDDIQGGNGDDYIVGGPGADTIDGGADFDTVGFLNAVQLNLTTGVHSGEATGDTYANIERYILTAYADVATGDGSANIFEGGGANDILNGLAGADQLYGGTGDDTLRGGDDDDYLVGGDGADFINGGAGYDTVYFATAVYLDLNSGSHTGEALGDTFLGIERYVFSEGNDNATAGNSGVRFDGQGGGDILTGGLGQDLLFGGADDDFLDGGDGDDVLVGGSGADFHEGGAGFDTVRYQTLVGLNLNTGVHTGDAVGDTFQNIERFQLSAFGDTFVGSTTVAAVDTVDGMAGNDILLGGLGDDFLDGGSGHDILQGGDGDDSLTGGNGGDNLQGGNGFDTVRYTTAVTVDLGGGADTGQAVGDSFNSIERFVLSDFADAAIGDTGDNRIEGAGGDDTLDGASGADNLNGGDGADDINGGDDNDYIVGGAGADAIDGGAGTYDTAAFLAAVTLNLTSGVHTGEALGDTFVDIERWLLSAFNDTAIGDGGAQVFEGGGGNDNLAGAGGADQLYGGDGDDGIAGGDGDDYIVGGAGGDAIDGGDGYDTVAFLGQVTVDLSNEANHTGEAAGDDYELGIERFVLSGFDDTFLAWTEAVRVDGGGGADQITGNTGNDTLNGEDGDDTLSGGDGNDVLTGGAGADAIDGGAGTDTVRFTSAAGAGIDLNTPANNFGDAVGDTFTGIEIFQFGSGGDQFDGDGDANTVNAGGGIDSLTGNGGNDVLNGGGGDDLLNGDDGEDTLNGGGGGDTLRGGNDDDTLNGGAGDDLLEGGGEADDMFGGAGADTLNGSNGNDLIDLGAGDGSADIVYYDAAGFDNDGVFNFEDGTDLIQFNYAAVDDISDLAITDLGGTDTLITAPDGSTIIVFGVVFTNITAADFIFGP